MICTPGSPEVKKFDPSAFSMLLPICLEAISLPHSMQTG